MIFQKSDSHESLSRRTADLIEGALLHKPDLLLCAASGDTPTRTYQILSEKCQTAPRTFTSMRVLKLDEWVGVGSDAEGSCERYLRTHLIRPLQITSERYLGFNADALDPSADCARIAQWLEARGPMDLCLLGIGTNGHIALNEPGRALAPHPHIVQLAESTRRHGMLANAGKPPTHGVTLGVADIMRAARVLLLISGPTKRAALQRLRRPEVTTDFPASLLWLHADCTVLYDAAAADVPAS